MLKKSLSVLGMVMLLLGFSSFAVAHCEIPCGIYGDETRIDMITEHILTVEKSMNQIAALGQEEPVNYNQLVRWVMNKETHATEIQDIISKYFLHQRIKPGDERYADKLKTLHAMLIEAMKCKQGTDLAHVTNLRKLLSEFKGLYFKSSH
ncbi:MAG: superoxide dismutase [Deltaproteobacteria bacterium]|nr:superoxide dismutase [Deltaproteobacteria bacterium]